MSTAPKRFRRVALPETAYGRGRTQTWGYTVACLAELFGVQPRTIRDWIRAVRFDPGSLRDIVRLARDREI